MMRISINSGLLSGRFGDAEALRLFAEAGFDAVDYTFCDYLLPDSPWQQNNKEEYALSLLENARRHRLLFNQAHAAYVYPWEKEDVVEGLVIPTVSENIRLCRRMQIDRIVVHGLSHPAVIASKEEQFQKNVWFYNQLKPAAKEAGVKIALENLRRVCTTPEDYERLMDTLDDPCFTACVDIGHSILAGVDVTQIIRRLGHDRVTLLHVHDNLTKTDDHMIPGTGMLDWNEILQALAEIHYSGDFTLEIINLASGMMDDHHGFDDDFVPDLLKFAHVCASYLAHKLLQRM